MNDEEENEIKLFLKKHRLTIKQLAYELSLSNSQICKLKSNKSNLTLKNYIKLQLLDDYLELEKLIIKPQDQPWIIHS